MHSYLRKKQKWKEKYIVRIMFLIGFLAVLLVLPGDGKVVRAAKQEAEKAWCHGIIQFYMPYVSCQLSGGREMEPGRSVFKYFFPVLVKSSSIEEYQTEIESTLSYETILAMEAASENYIDPKTGQLVGEEVIAAKDQIADESGVAEEQEHEEEEVLNQEESQDTGNAQMQTAEVSGVSQKVVTYPREKLLDFDYLIQNFYRVDKTTTINGSQLNAEEMLAKNMTLTHDASIPQILIYHTHSQEGYADSVPGDPAMSVVGVGEYLTQILTEQYGFNVIHHTGEYDAGDRDHAYSKAGPALEQILADNPGIEVVIDLHRDGVGENTRLVTNQNGTDMAQIMFVNGLSRTTGTGDIAYLYNPNLADNLAFSFQTELAAAEYYPGLSRGVYLKGYRFNMHYCPKTLLVEVGAQTNTLQEAKNAMMPLADIIYKVVGGMGY